MSMLQDLYQILFWAIVLCAAVALIYWRGFADLNRIKDIPIPGPRLWPYVGNLPDVFRYGGMHNMLLEYFKKYGRVYKMGFGRRPTIVVTDPDMIKHITIKEFCKFQTRWFPEVNPPINAFLFIARDEQWKRIRSTLTPTFSALKLKQVVPLMETSADILTDELIKSAESGSSVKVNPLFSLFALDVIINAAFGIQVNLQVNPDPEMVKKAREVFRTPLWVRAFSMFPFSNFFSKKLNISPLNHTDYFLKLARSIYDTRKKQQIPARSDLIQLMIEGQKQGFEGVGKGLSDDEVSAQSVIFMVAGFETTGSTLSYMAYVLAKYPEIQDRLIEEIDEACRNRRDMPLYDFVNTLEYLDQVLSEVLRLYTPGFLVHRRCQESCTINGVDFPAGIDVFMPPYVLHRDPQIWPDPETFDPERFSPERRQEQIAYSYMPFGMGPRQCIGFRFALLEIKIAMLHILSNVMFERAADTTPQLNFRSVLIMQPKDPIFLKVVVRPTGKKSTCCPGTASMSKKAK